MNGAKQGGLQVLTMTRKLQTQECNSELTERWVGTCGAHWDLESPLKLVEEARQVGSPIDQP